jgi:hypothetical protein
VLELEVAGQVAERPDPRYVRVHLPDPEPGRLLSSAVKLAHLAGIKEGLRSARVRAGGPWTGAQPRPISAGAEGPVTAVDDDCTHRIIGTEVNRGDGKPTGTLAVQYLHRRVSAAG